MNALDGSFDSTIGTDSDNMTGPEQCTVLSVDNQGPQTTYINVTPNPVTSGGEVTFSAIVDDNLTGVSNIESAEYSLAGDTWKRMNPQDGSFDSPTETVVTAFTVLKPEGDYAICVRGMDILQNTGAATCTQLSVTSTPVETPSIYIPIVLRGLVIP